MDKIKINVKTISGKLLTFNNVLFFEIIEGGFVKFTDSYTNKVKIFHSSNCEIEEGSNK